MTLARIYQKPTQLLNLLLIHTDNCWRSNDLELLSPQNIDSPGIFFPHEWKVSRISPRKMAPRIFSVFEYSELNVRFSIECFVFFKLFDFWIFVQHKVNKMMAKGTRWNDTRKINAIFPSECDSEPTAEIGFHGHKVKGHKA